MGNRQMAVGWSQRPESGVVRGVSGAHDRGERTPENGRECAGESRLAPGGVIGVPNFRAHPQNSRLWSSPFGEAGWGHVCYNRLTLGARESVHIS